MPAHRLTTQHTHPPTGAFIKRKIVVFPAVEQSLIWTRGARAAPNMNATVVQFTARITLMYWATKFKGTTLAVCGELLKLQSNKRELRLYLRQACNSKPV